jgi:hypothetical protein
MLASRLNHISESNSADCTGGAPSSDSVVERKRVGINPWVAICILALVGWSLDSILVSVELHSLEGGDFRAHMTHFWYGPLLLLAALLLVRRLLPRATLWVPHFSRDSITRFGRQAGVKRLADHLASRPVEATVLGVLLSYPNTAMISQDLAEHAGVVQADTDRSLRELGRLGLVQEMQLAGASFYRLTREGQLCDELRELQEWHRLWQRQTERLFSAVAPLSVDRSDGEPRGLR